MTRVSPAPARSIKNATARGFRKDEEKAKGFENFPPFFILSNERLENFAEFCYFLLSLTKTFSRVFDLPLHKIPSLINYLLGKKS